MQMLTRFEYLCLLLGITLAFISALIPHYATGYYLAGSIFIAGVLPWLVYAVAVPLMHSTVTAVCGLLLLLAHGWLVVSERFLVAQPYQDNTIYVAPVILALLLLPLAIVAARRSWKRMMQRRSKPDSDTHATA